jgi:hypothetical protein
MNLMITIYFKTMKSFFFADIDTRILQILTYFAVGFFCALLYIYSADLKNAIM